VTPIIHMGRHTAGGRLVLAHTGGKPRGTCHNGICAASDTHLHDICGTSVRQYVSGICHVIDSSRSIWIPWNWNITLAEFLS
jgi:hypothetical protein